MFSKRTFFCFSLFLLVLPTLHAFAQSPLKNTRTVSAIVRDGKTRAPIHLANVVSRPGAFGGATNRAGRVSFKLPRKALTLSFSHIGYKKQTLTLPPGKADTSLIVFLKPAALTMQEIDIEAEREQAEPGRFKIRGAEIQDIPDFVGEPVNAVKTLPGVASNNELSNAYQVQGGSADENLILLDGVEITRPQRIRSSSHENFTPINRMLLQEMTFMAGGFPATFGERLSSVLLAKYRDFSAKKFSGEAEASLMNAAIMLQGQANEKLYWAASARVADRRFLLKTLQVGGDFSPRAFDVQAHLKYKMTKRNSLKLFLFEGENAVTVEPTHYDTQVQIGVLEYISYHTAFAGFEKFTQRSRLVSLNWESRLAANFKVKNIVALGRFFEHEEVDKSSETRRNYFNPLLPELETEETLVNVGLIRGDDKLYENMRQYHGEIEWRVKPGLKIIAGGQIFERDYDDVLSEEEIERTAAPDSIRVYPGYFYQFEGRAQIKTRQAAGYQQISFKAGEKIKLTGGVRYSYYSPSEESVWQPRLSFLYQKDETTRLRFAWGRYAQPPRYHEFRDTQNRLYPETRAQQATHYVASLQHFKQNGAEYQLQIFYKDLSRIIPYKLDDIFFRYQPELQASGRIYGGSAWWRGHPVPRLTSWLTYTWMNTKQNIAGEGESRLPSDQKHTFAAVLQDNMPEFPNSRAHLRFVFGSGYPYTSVGTTVIENGKRELVEGRRNAFRLRFYRRLDVGFSKTFPLASGRSARATFEIFNMFDFRNLLTYDVFIDGEGRAAFAPLNLSRRFFSVRGDVKF